jgi:hypothetical protein
MVTVAYGPGKPERPAFGVFRSKTMLSALATEAKPRVIIANIASEIAILRKLNCGDIENSFLDSEERSS